MIDLLQTHSTLFDEGINSNIPQVYKQKVFVILIECKHIYYLTLLEFVYFLSNTVNLRNIKWLGYVFNLMDVKLNFIVN